MAFYKRLVSALQDGPAHHLPQEVVLQHQEQQEEGCQDPWWQAGLPVPEEAPFRAQVPQTGLKLKGVTPATNQEKARMSRRQKTVFMAYGGVLSHKAVREKVVRAFLIEEQKIVMKVLKAQGKN